MVDLLVSNTPKKLVLPEKPVSMPILLAEFKAVLESLKKSDSNKLVLGNNLSLALPPSAKYIRNQKEFSLKSGTYTPLLAVSKDDAAAFLFAPDIAQVLLGIASWIAGTFQEDYGNLLTSNDLEILNKFTRSSDEEANFFIGEDYKKVEAALELLLEIVEEKLEPLQKDQTEKFASLDEIIKILEKPREDFLKFWESDLEPLLIAATNTNKGQTSIEDKKHQLRYETTQVRSVFHFLIEKALKELADPEKTRSFLISPRHKALEENDLRLFLNGERERLAKPEEELVFPEKASSADILTDTSAYWSQADVEKANALKTFLIDSELMDRLIDKKKLEPLDTPTDDKDSDNDNGGGGDDKEESTGPLERTQLLAQIKRRLIEDIGLSDALLDYEKSLTKQKTSQQAYQDRISVERLINNTLKALLEGFLPEKLLVRLATDFLSDKTKPDGSPADLLWDKTSLRIYQTEHFKDFRTSLIALFVEELLKTHNVPKNQLATALISEALSFFSQDTAQTTADTQNMSDEVDKALKAPSSAADDDTPSPLTTNLQALVEKYRQEKNLPNQQNPTSDDLRNYWASLDISQRVRLYRDAQLKMAGGYFTDLVLAEYLRTHGVTDLSQLSPQLRFEFAQLSQKIIFELPLDQVLLILEGDTKYLVTLSREVVAKYDSGVFAGEFELKARNDLTNQLATKRAAVIKEINGTIGAEDKDFAAAALTVDSLLLMFPDPIRFIDGISLESDQPEALLSALFGLRFAADLETLAKARGLNKEGLLLFIKAKLKEYYRLRYQELLQETKQAGLGAPLYEAIDDDGYASPQSYAKHIQIVSQLQLDLRAKAREMGALDEKEAEEWARAALSNEYDIKNRRDEYLKYQAEMRSRIKNAFKSEKEENTGTEVELTTFDPQQELRQNIGKQAQLAAIQAEDTNQRIIAQQNWFSQRSAALQNLFNRQQNQATQEGALAKTKRVAESIKKAVQTVKKLGQVAKIAGAIWSAVMAAYTFVMSALAAIPFIGWALAGLLNVGLIAGAVAGLYKLAEAVYNLVNSSATGTIAATPTATATSATPASAVGSTAATTTSTIGTFLPVAGSVGIAFAGTAFMMISHSAFIDPVGPTLEEAGELSKYVSVSKLADQDSFQNSESPKKVTYTITFTPKQNLTLTNANAPASSETGGQPYTLQIKNVTDTFTNLGKAENGTAVDLVSPLSISQMPPEPVSSPQEFAYELDLGASADVMVNNTVEFTFDVIGPDGSILAANETIKATASVRVGEPVLGCFEFMGADPETGEYPSIYDGGSKPTNAWSEPDKERILQAYLLRAGSNPTFNELVCKDGPIKMYRISDAGTQGVVDGFYYGGVKVGLDGLAFYNASFNYSLTSLEYTLIHELGHILDVRNPELLPDFLSIYTPGNPNKPCFTYPLAGNCNDKEAFAESVALFVVFRNYRFRDGEFDFYGLERAEHDWIQEKIYGGATF